MSYSNISATSSMDRSPILRCLRESVRPRRHSYLIDFIGNHFRTTFYDFASITGDGRAISVVGLVSR
jgi:hypothetical protein